MNKPPFRMLRGYSLDPGFSTRLDTAGINEIVYHVPWEDVTKGPCGEYFEVIDYDPASNCFYDPAELNSVEALAQNGFAPSEGNPKFHQQFVYTIAMKTLEHFEKSLGRKILWQPRMIFENEKEVSVRKQKGIYTPPAGSYVARLRLYPHAFRDANAFYSPEKRSVLFGYFEAASKLQGTNLPGGVIFTCLSPDIVAHEITHAILDSIHPRFIENTNPDVGAFHEAFADIVALLQRFTITPLVEHQIAQTRGNLGEFSFLGELATQFGNALQYSRGALRGAIGAVDRKSGKWKKFIPDPEKYQSIFEPHERGAILVATIFDAFIRLYNVKTADLMRIASNGTGILQPGAIHPDLTKRLAQSACEIAEHLLHICIRALDYCPPLDVNFGDYLRALITADMDTSPRDTNGYRIALIEAFRSWGIFPDRVNTLSTESLSWSKPYQMTAQEKEIWKYIARELKPDIRNIVDISLSGNGREEIYIASYDIQRKLHGILAKKPGHYSEKILSGLLRKHGEDLDKAWSDFLRKLGLTDEPVKFKYGDEVIQTREVPKLEVHKIRPVYRVGREGKIVEQIMITLTQTVRLRSGPLSGAKFRGGCTLILNMAGDYDVEYIIYKNVMSEHRFGLQMDYQSGKNINAIALSDSMYEEECGFEDINFAHLHFHNNH